jgi:hypothetical protein
MRTTKLLGLLLVGLSLILIVLPAALPATVVHEGGLNFQARNDGCGAAIVAALERQDEPCGYGARQRLLLTTAGGIVLLVAGVVLASDPNTHYRSRVEARR